MPERRFSDDLPQFLQALANEVPPPENATSAVLRRLNLPASQRRRWHGRFTVPLAALAAFLVVGLLGTVLAHRASHIGATTGCVGGRDLGLACPVTDQGISVQPLQASADAYATMVQVVISGAKDAIYDPTLLDPMLTDEHGHFYIATSNGYNGKVPQSVIATLFFTPLSPPDLAQPQTLTLTVTRIKPTNGSPDMYLAPDKPPLTGKWQMRFTITPILSKRYPVQMSPSVQRGIGLQVHSLEAAPQPDGTVGIRVLLSVSGVPPGTATQTFEDWTPNPNQMCTALAEDCKTVIFPPVAQLEVPGWQGSNISNLISQIVYPPKLDPTKILGISGTVEMELLLSGTGMPTSGTVTFHLTNFRLQQRGNPSPTVGTAFPAWDITFVIK